MATIREAQTQVRQERGIKLIYVAGPMSGLPDHNFPAFRACRDRLKAKGFGVMCPPDFPINSDASRARQLANHHYLRHDIERLILCNGIALLPGWEKSTGARCEAAIMKTLGMHFYNELGEQIDTPAVISITCGYTDGWEE